METVKPLGERFRVRLQDTLQVINGGTPSKNYIKIQPGIHDLERIANPYPPNDAPWLVLVGTMFGQAEGAWRQWEGAKWGKSEVQFIPTGIDIADSTQWLKLSDVMVSSKQFDKNYYAPKKDGVFDHCALCGKHVANKGENTAWIEHTTSGLLIPNGVEVPIEGTGDYQGHQSQGCFPVGPECAKKVKGYVSYWKP